MAGFDNDVVYADNVDFSGSVTPAATVTTNGQLLIGATAAPNIRVGNLTSSDSSVTVTNGAGTISLTVAGGTTVGKTITGNTGGALSPTAGNWNIVGTGSMTTAGSGSTLTAQLTGLTNHAVLVGAGTATITNVLSGAAGYLFVQNTAGSDPVFSNTLNLSGNNITFLETVAGNTPKFILQSSDNTNTGSNAQISITQGGTGGGTTNLTFNKGSARSWSIGMRNGVNTALLINTAAGADVNPETGTNLLSLTTAGVFSLPQSGFTTNGVFYSAATGVLTATAAGTTGQVLTAVTSGAPIWSTPQNTNTWTAISANQTLAVNNGYFCTGGGALSLALPATSAVGDVITVTLDGSTSWTITQPNAGTQIRIGNTQTTLGVGGSLASSAVGDVVTLRCQTANARWQVTSSMGNITVV